MSILIGLLAIVVLFLLGALNAQQVIAEKHEKAKELIGKILPFESYLGLAGIVLGVIGILNSLAAPFIYALFGIAVGAIMAVLGLFSSIHFIKSQLLANNQGVSEKLDGLISKVQSHQVTLGLVGMGLSVLFLLMTIA